jgi:hypothetical protein
MVVVFNQTIKIADSWMVENLTGYPDYRDIPCNQMTWTTDITPGTL